VSHLRRTNHDLDQSWVAVVSKLRRRDIRLEPGTQRGSKKPPFDSEQLETRKRGFTSQEPSRTLTESTVGRSISLDGCNDGRTIGATLVEDKQITQHLARRGLKTMLGVAAGNEGKPPQF
jgi:hypothetical protein